MLSDAASLAATDSGPPRSRCSPNAGGPGCRCPSPPPTARFPRACNLLLDGLAVLATQGYAAGAPTLMQALSVVRDEPMSAGSP